MLVVLGMQKKFARKPEVAPHTLEWPQWHCNLRSSLIFASVRFSPSARPTDRSVFAVLPYLSKEAAVAHPLFEPYCTRAWLAAFCASLLCFLRLVFQQARVFIQPTTRTKSRGGDMGRMKPVGRGREFGLGFSEISGEFHLVWTNFVGGKSRVHSF